MRSIRRRRMLLEGLAISAVLWAILALCAWLFDAHSPYTRALYVSAREGTVVQRHWDQWGRAALFGLIAQTLWIKAWLMYRRTRRGSHSRIGWSLIWFNFAFAVVSSYWLLLLMWPQLRSDHPWVATWGWVLWLAFACLWATFELSLSTDPIDPERGVVLERDEATGIVRATPNRRRPSWQPGRRASDR